MTPNLKHLRTVASEATQGEWELWDGNSWRRFGIKGKQGERPFLYPIVWSDGQPDIVMRREDADYIAAANPQTMIALLDLIEQMGAALLKQAEASDVFLDNTVEALQAYEKMKGERENTKNQRARK